MKYILLTLVFFLISCTLGDYQIEDMPYKELSYEKLPLEVQKYLSETTTGFNNNDIKVVEEKDSATYRLESVETLVGPWIECMKLINTKKNIVYRIEQGTPFPYIIYKKKLYIPNKYLYFYDGDYRSAKYNEYSIE